MAIYAGLDVSDKQTHICVVDAALAIMRRNRGEAPRDGDEVLP